MSQFVLKQGENKKIIFTGSKEKCEDYLNRNFSKSLHTNFTIISIDEAKIEQPQKTEIPKETVKEEIKKEDEENTKTMEGLNVLTVEGTIHDLHNRLVDLHLSGKEDDTIIYTMFLSKK